MKYTPPQLRRLGSLADLTMGSSGPNVDMNGKPRQA
jgi:hypothetical protein